MVTPHDLTRREFLRMAGVGAGTLAAAGLGALESAAPAGADGILPVRRGDSTADLELALRAGPARLRLYPGAPTQLLSYQATLLRGNPSSLQALPNTYLGPILRVRRGQNIRVYFVNGLAEKSIVHWHGLRVPAAMDGHPDTAIAPGRIYTYDFQVVDRAGTYWFHPHPDMRTGRQVYYGLAGLFLVSDEDEDSAGLPTGAYDVPLIIQDRKFDRSNQLVYLSGMMDQMMGFLGDQILVNGQPGYTLPVSTRPYRLRLLNGSNFRIYKLAWSDGMPLTVIGTDGGLLEAPVTRSYVTLAPGERIDLWVDFGGRAVNTTVKMVSLPFSGVEGNDGMMGVGMGSGQGVTTGPMGGMGQGGGMMPEAMGGMGQGGGRMGGSMGGMGQGGGMGGEVPPNGAPLDILTVRIRQRENARSAAPTRLSSITRLRLSDAVNGTTPRMFELTMRNGQWLINGRTFATETSSDAEVVRLNTTEVWEIVNKTNPGEMTHPMGMGHPLHIHGAQFQVLERHVLPELIAGWETVRQGYVDEGWRDTVLLMPGERAKLLVRFGPYAGTYVYHCHNLEHEDMGMMRNYVIRA
jgi:FtsP/CotA-like multicopper oxidase with cupredoxin domain